MNTKTVKTVVKAFVLFGLVLGSTVDVMAVNEQRVQALMYQKCHMNMQCGWLTRRLEWSSKKLATR
ncbi:hypothetical protein AGMMS49921_04700 [Endomicrobiia bacterium]|nr:hypothetical protein AGMMS49921_04700 [Endomicrobiia bacterium]